MTDIRRRHAFLLLAFILSQGLFSQYCFHYERDGGIGMGSNLSQLTTADFNQDGSLDLVVADAGTNSITVLFGSSTGTFSIVKRYTLPSYANAITNSDFDGDGLKDLAVACTGANSIIIFKGNGDGSFLQTHSFSVNAVPVVLVTGDLNHDSKADLITSSFGTGKISILLGNGNCTFSLSSDIYLGNYPCSIVIADFNEDNNTDIALVVSGRDTAIVLFGTGNGAFPFYGFFSVGTRPTSITSADFNNDGHADLVITNVYSNDFRVFLGDGAGHFTLKSTVGRKDVDLVTHADFDKDGKEDLVTANGNAFPGMTVFLGNGDGTFQPLIMLNSRGSSILTEDFDQDGFPDIISSLTKSIFIFLHCNTTRINGFVQPDYTLTILPNPANANQTIQIHTAQQETVQVQLLDISGRLINTWQMNSNPTGITEINAQLESLENGIYFYCIKIGEATLYRKVLKE
jgi:hypothetical protein